MKFTAILFFSILLFSCQSNTKPPVEKIAPQTTEETTDRVIEKRGDMTITKIKPIENIDEQKVKEVIGVYFSATVYTGSTDYFFKNPKGKTFSFRQSNLEEEQKFQLPAGMLEPVSDGVPGANPAMIGKRFKIIYGDDGEVEKIQLLN